MLDKIQKEIEDGFFSESEVLQKFLSISKDDDDYKICAEIMAFRFLENNQNSSKWNTYFGSFSSYPQQDGSLLEIPSLKDVNKDVIKYWNERIDNTSNPVLKARYSGLIWDFTYIVLKEKPHYDIAIIYIQSLLKIIDGRLQSSFNLIRKIKRALSVSISISNKELINEIKNKFILLEQEIGENKKPGLWGFSYDSLIGNSKSNLSKSEEFDIINKLEQRLLDVTSGKDFSTWASELIIKRLAPYYKKKNKLIEAQRVLKIHGQAVVQKDKYSMLLQYQSALKDLQVIYSKYGMKNDSNELLKEIKKIGVDVFDEMQVFTSSVKISKKDIDEVIVPITTGTKNEVFNKLIYSFTPQLNRIIKSLNDNARDFALSNLFNTSIIDETGREVAEIGSLENDLTGNIIHQISQDFDFNSFYLRESFNRIVNDLNFTSDDFIKFIKSSPIISKNRISIIEKGVQAYFNQDYLVYEHLLIPQIETAIRSLIEQNNGAVLEPSVLGGFHLKTFNKLLLEQITKRSLGDDVQMYFRALYTDPRGWNLRNKVCHGLSESSSFNNRTSERIIHTLLIIGAVRKN